ncbi:flagellar hook-basal body protein [Oleiharenicola lentus]|jgi:flagellar basal body rod protein FlgG|uniref:Flagellar hook-basal body protein n=1 Tax=Oleiharenicola lentus TaxID=2508720 RepID=A0A4Q1C3L8_9BACT|nr:flagellar hook-basal body protein [Oleiharenicola lentus]RXK52947.1 flagellar hook-basal body protein [Oleiharenicola lentus]
MNIGLYQSAASLAALERWQDNVSQNITSAQTTGYRKRTIQFSTETAGEVRPGRQGKNGEGAGVAAVFPKTSNGINFISGETMPTRRELDIAIQGEGFFEIQTPDGGKAYTRSGEFRLRPDRTLVTSSGLEVLNTNGDPFVLLPGGGNIVVNQDGTVFQGSVSLGKLSIQKFANTAALMPTSGGMFLATPGSGMQEVEEPELMQGYLEQSNVQPLREMVDLVLISRAYEANQKMITTIDQQMEKALQALG